MLKACPIHQATEDCSNKAPRELYILGLFSGFRALWTPEVPLRVVVLWILVFLYTGRSSVTESRVSFYVCHHKT